MNLPQLIEYIAETGYKTKSYTSNDNGAVVGVGLLKGIFINGTIFPNHTFTVEIEEPITEDTAIHKLIELSDKGLLGRTILNINSSINLAKTEKSVAFYILNDDLTMTLIWRDGKLVE